MSDAQEIESLAMSSNEMSEPSYTKENYVELFDQNNGQYATGQIQFNTESQSKHHVVYSESYLALPLACSKTTDGRVAVKNSVLSFIQGLQIESSSGTSICNESISTPIVANLRLLLDSSLDFRDANELMYYGPDKTISLNVSGDDTSIVGGVLPTATSGRGLIADALNFLKNPALQNRITVLFHRSTLVAAAAPANAMQQFVAYIPLKFIHDFFAQMNFPIINLNLRMNFNISGAGSYSAFCPWTAPVYPAHSTLGPLATPAAPANLGATLAALVASPVMPSSDSTAILSAYTDRFGAKHAPRLFLKTVYFDAETAAAVKSKIVAGYTKTLTYTCSNYYQQVLLAGAASAGVNWPFVQGIIRPTRLWVFPLAQGTLASAANTFPARTGPVVLTNTNLVLNGDQFYQKNMYQQYEFYRELKKQLICAGTSQAAATPLSFSDFISGSAYYCFDVSRNLQVKTNNLCTFALQTDLIDQSTAAVPAGALDMYIIVERLQTVTLKISEGGVEVITKQGTID